MQAPFKYTLTFKDINQNADPLGIDKAKIKYEKPSDCIFFRQKLTDKLTFKGEEFKFLHAIEKSGERCLEIGLQIDAYCQGAYTPRFKGYFSLNDVSFNIDKGTAVVAPKTNDLYRAIMDNYGKKFNILELPATHTVTAELNLTAAFEFKQVLKGGIVNEENSETWSEFIHIRRGHYAMFTSDILYRMVRTEPLANNFAPDLTGEGWTYISETATHATYAKAPAIYEFKPYLIRSTEDFTALADLELVSCGAAVPAGFIDTGCHTVVAGSDHKIGWRMGLFTFNRNRTLLAAVRHLVKETTKQLDYLPANTDYLPATDAALSEFFTSATNYATGQSNKLLDLLIAQKSDIIAHRSSEAATKGLVSLKELLTALKTAFNVSWFINDLGKFQLEHVSYFEQEEIVDLTAPAFAPFVKGTNAYDYDKSKMPRYERLLFSESEQEDFKEATIEYGGVCVNYEEGQDKTEQTVNLLNNDLSQLLISGGSLNKEGFVLLAHANGQVLSEAGDATGATLLNGHLSAANLLKNYHLWDRVLPTGVLNGKLTTFKSVLKTKKQISLSVPACCNTFSPYARYITSVSAKGTLDTMEIELKDGLAKLDILHEVTGDGAALISRQFSDQFSTQFS